MSARPPNANPSITTSQSSPARAPLAWLALCLAAVLPYLNALPNDFVWDDRPLILYDHQIRSLSNIGAIFQRDFFASSEDQMKYGYFRPLITISYMTDLALWGSRPWGFRVTNIAFHAACTVFVLLIARRLRLGSPAMPWIAGWLFALHPVHVESVSWIAGRTDVLATFFLLLSLWLYLRASEAQRPLGLHLAALAAWAAAALCKETALIFPILIFSLERQLRGAPLTIVARRNLPFLIGVILYVLWRATNTSVGRLPALWMDPALYLGAAFKTLARYFGKLIWPVRLSAYIQNPPPQHIGDPFMWGGVTLAAAAAWLCFKVRRTPRYGWLITAFFLSLLPVMNLVRISAPADMGFPMAERFLYLPSVFFCLAAALALEKYIQSPARLFAFATLLGILFAVRIATRNADWRDGAVFFQRSLREAPSAPLLRAEWAATLAREKRYDEALTEMDLALRLNAEQSGLISPFLQHNKAAVLRQAGRYQDALALLDTLVTFTNKPSFHYQRGACLAALGREDEARAAYERALAINSNHLESCVALAEWHAHQGQWERAAEYYRRAASLFPDQPTLQNALGVCLKNAGDLDQALVAFRKASRMSPADPDIRANLGVALALKGDTPGAERELSHALSLNPRHTDALGALGTLYGDMNRFANAERCFRAILNIETNHAEAMVNMGVLRYRQGKTNEARVWFSRALQCDPAHSRARAFLSRLDRNGAP